jgi:C4-dicarboxylate-specific signal transduction histidine kinase
MKDFIHISLQNKTVLVTDMSGNLWFASNYKEPQWIKLDTKGKTFMASQNIN